MSSNPPKRFDQWDQSGGGIFDVIDEWITGSPRGKAPSQKLPDYLRYSGGGYGYTPEAADNPLSSVEVPDLPNITPGMTGGVRSSAAGPYSPRDITLDPATANVPLPAPKPPAAATQAPAAQPATTLPPFEGVRSGASTSAGAPLDTLMDPVAGSDEPQESAADSYLRFAWEGGKPQDVTPGAGLGASRFGDAPSEYLTRGPGRGFGRTYDQPAAGGGLSVMGKPFVDPHDIEEAQKGQALQLAQQDPHEAYFRKADIDRQKAVAIAAGTEEAKDAIRGRRELSIQGDLNAINEEIAEIDAALGQIDTDPRYLALPPEQQAAKKAQLAGLKAQQEARRDARVQAAGIATGNAPGQMFKRDDD